MARTAGKSHGTQSHAPPAAQLPGLSRIIQPSPHSPLCPRTKAHPLGSRTDGAPTLSPIGSNDGPETSALHPLPTLRTDKDNDKDKDKDNDNIQDSRRRKARDTRHVTKRNHRTPTMTRVLRSPKDATPFRHRLHKHKHGNAEQTFLYYKQTQIQQTHHHLKKHQTRPNAKPHLLQPTNYRNDNASDARSEPWNQ